MPNSVSPTVARLCRKLDLPKGASLHVLRHSHASLTADIYSHAIRGKDHAAALSWDDIMQPARSEKSTGVN